MLRSRHYWPRIILFLACRTADLKKECAEKGLSDEGDDETLRWRLAHFDDHDMEWLKHHEEKAVAAIKIKTERERKQSEKDVWIEKWAKMRSVSLHLLCYKCKCTVCAHGTFTRAIRVNVPFAHGLASTTLANTLPA